jgi:hypothetical protein
MPEITPAQFDKQPPEGMPDRQAELAATEGPRGHTWMGQVKDAAGQAGNIAKATAPFAGGALGSVLGGRMVDDEGSTALGRIARQVGGAAVGGGLGNLAAGGSATEGALGAATGEAVGMPVGSALGSLGRRIGPVRTYELGKYIGKLGDKLSEYWGGIPIKNRQQLYEALHFGDEPGGAGHAVTEQYKRGVDAILGKVGPKTVLNKIDPQVAERLNELFLEGTPREVVVGGKTDLFPIQKRFKEAYEQHKLANPLKTGTRMTESDFKRYFNSQHPLTLEDALAYAKHLGSGAGESAAGTAGVAKRSMNREARDAISDLLDKAVPRQGLGQSYKETNEAMHRGMTVLRALDPKEFFKPGLKEPQFSQSKFQQTTEKNLEDLRKVFAEELDDIARFNMKPGATGQDLRLHGRLGSPGVPGHPGFFSQFHLPFPNIGPSSPGQKIVRDLWRAISAGTGSEMAAPDDESK